MAARKCRQRPPKSTAPARRAVPLIGGTYEGLRSPMGEFLRTVTTHAPELGLATLSDQQIDAIESLMR